MIQIQPLLRLMSEEGSGFGTDSADFVQKHKIGFLNQVYAV